MGRWGANCAASTATRAPRSWANATTAERGTTSPVTLEAPVMASRAPGRSSRACSNRASGLAPRWRPSSDATVEVALPREQVGVVLDVQVDDLAAGGHGTHQQVEPVGGIAGEDDDVIGAGADELPRTVARADSYSDVLTRDR